MHTRLFDGNGKISYTAPLQRQRFRLVGCFLLLMFPFLVVVIGCLIFLLGVEYRYELIRDLDFCSRCTSIIRDRNDKKIIMRMHLVSLL